MPKYTETPRVQIQLDSSENEFVSNVMVINKLASKAKVVKFILNDWKRLTEETKKESI